MSVTVLSRKVESREPSPEAVPYDTAADQCTSEDAPHIDAPVADTVTADEGLPEPSDLSTFIPPDTALSLPEVIYVTMENNIEDKSDTTVLQTYCSLTLIVVLHVCIITNWDCAMECLFRFCHLWKVLSGVCYSVHSLLNNVIVCRLVWVSRLKQHQAVYVRVSLTRAHTSCVHRPLTI